LFHHCLHLRYLAHVGLDQNRAPSAGPHLTGDTLGGTVVVEPIDRDVGASCGKLQRHRAADPLLRPCDQNHPASELHIQLP
jgi:hypothetical protein